MTYVKVQVQVQVAYVWTLWHPDNIAVHDMVVV